MPRNYRRNNRNSQPRRGNVNYKKLMDKKINTALEVRMTQIAQSQLKTLVNRKWLAGGDPQNVATPPRLGPAGENVSYHGYQDITAVPYVSAYIDTVKASDINMTLNQPDPLNPDAAGVNRGMITDTMHGFRKANHIRIKAISLDFRCKSDFGINALHNADNNTALEIIARNYEKTQGRIFLDYKLVLVSVSDTNQALPAPEDVAVLALKYNDWGYSPSLDVAHEEVQRAYKYKTLLSGRVNCSPRISFSKHGRDVAPVPLQNEDPTANIIPFFREWKQYKKFNPPIKIEYAATDQTGHNKTMQAIYFIAKSNYDPTGATNPAEQSACPRIAVIGKCFYYD